MPETSEILALTYSGNDHNEASVVTKAVTDSYMDLVAYKEKSRRVESVSQLEQAIQENFTNLKNKMGNMQKQAKALGTNNPEEAKRQQDENLAVLRDLRTQRTALATEKARAQAGPHALLTQHRFPTNPPVGALGGQLDKFNAEVDELDKRQIKAVETSNDVETLRREIDLEAKVLDDMRERAERMKADLRAPDRIAIHQESDLQKRDNKKQILAAPVPPLGVFFALCLAVAHADSPH